MLDGFDSYWCFGLFVQVVLEFFIQLYIVYVFMLVEDVIGFVCLVYVNSIMWC